MGQMPHGNGRVCACLSPDLLWRDVRIPRFERPAPALFLDRDGVIIEEKRYLSDPAGVQLLPGAVDLIRQAHSLGLAVIEVTNQAGIGRGKYGWPEFAAVEGRLTELLTAARANIDAVFACPFHPDGQGPYRHANHPWRKPNPGMLVEAAALLNLDLAKCMLVGDKASDIEAARAAGLNAAIHVLTGHGRGEAARSRTAAGALFQVWVVPGAGSVLPLLAGFRDDDRAEGEAQHARVRGIGEMGRNPGAVDLEEDV